MDVMLDIETLSTRPESVVLTLGAVKFSPWASDVNTDDGLYVRVNVDEQLESGRHVQQDTVDWWGKQAEDVREEALGDHNRTDVEEFLNQLNKFVVGADNIWCQGPAFDIVILEDMFRQYDHHVPWPFWKIKDSRTLFGIMPSDPRKEIKFAAHNALEDCKVQALCVQQTVKKLGLQLR